MPSFPPAIEVVDSHTEGEPTRIVIDGWPQPEGVTMEARRDDLARRFDHLRRAVVCEPRGYDAIVGGLLTPPVSDDSEAGIIFFNNASYLGMCGHGLIGAIRTLEHLGRIDMGTTLLDTPVGQVAGELHPDGSVTIQNVPAWSDRLDVEIGVPGVGQVCGDIAWGGNWFFLAELETVEISLRNLPELMRVTRAIRATLDAEGLIPVDDRELIHVELFGPPEHHDADSRNFVLCPGGEYDRSPCGTGTSAKLAVLYERGQLELGDIWRQESVTGSLFTCWLEERDGDLIPNIRGRAWVTGRTTLLFDPTDELRAGIAAE
jgi:4-hydroxyproline epimerase